MCVINHTLKHIVEAFPAAVKEVNQISIGNVKKIQLVQTCMEHSSVGPCKTNWELCLLCQKETSDDLMCPAKSRRTDTGSGYSTLAANLVKFEELGTLTRTLQLDRLDEGHGIEAAMVLNNGHWHKPCALHYNTTESSEEASG